MQADVFHGLFEVDVAHDPHLRKVQFGTSGAEDFAFEEREGRVTPAGSAAALVLDRGDGQDFDVGETVAFRGGRVGRLCRGSERVAERKCGENRFFHQSFGFRCLLSCGSLFTISRKKGIEGNDVFDIRICRRRLTCAPTVRRSARG